MDLLLQALAVIGGFGVLVKAADIFCHQAVNIAHLSKVSPLLISMTLIPLGTSAPELFVSIVAAADGIPLLATGNVIGSNIINIALGFGIAASISPILINGSVLKLEIPIMFISSLVFGWMILNLHLSLLEGVIMLIGISLTILAISYRERRKKQSPQTDEVTGDSVHLTRSWLYIMRVLIIFITMAALLYLSSVAVVWGASGIATYIGVSELIVGLTIVAIGTSLPEIAVTVSSVLKGQHEVALGNVIGSNNINLLAVLGSAVVVQPHILPSSVLWRDYAMMLLVSVVVVLFCFLKLKGDKVHIQRWQGAVFVSLYIGYTSLLVLSA